MVEELRPDRIGSDSGGEVAADHRFVSFMSRHGAAVMIVELILLGLATFAAIGADDYWRHREVEDETGTKRAREPIT
jgi:hypothetical protein